jgi:hypothetical protein
MYLHNERMFSEFPQSLNIARIVAQKYVTVVSTKCNNELFTACRE